MPKVIFSSTMGFCMGVRKAVETTESEIEASGQDPVYTFGPLIHNEYFLDQLKKRGVGILNRPEQGEPGSVVIRAHGVAPQEKERIGNYHKRVLDATCPNVLKNQRTVKEYSDKGYQILIVGDKNHGEILGMAGYAKDVTLLAEKEEAEKVELASKVMVISQTTLKKQEYDAICSVLMRRKSDIIVVQSICGATARRQKDLAKLCKKVDAILVIGGSSSANTKRLYKTALEEAVPAWHITGVNEIPKDIYQYEKVGITAGASTPDDLINKVAEKIDPDFEPYTI